MEPGALSDVLATLRLTQHPDLLIGLSVSDDAAVYRLNGDTALVQTVDFFPPIVDDPYTFGAIAAANALSDVYAMGAKPILALAIAGFPRDLDQTVIHAILQGGADKVAEAGAVLAGGHTIADNEPKYGLCVTGVVHPNRVTPKANAQAGDLIYLTKPLGTGIITTAIKRNQGDQAHLEAAIASMTMLNKRAAEHIATVGMVHSVTDVTGFGLLGHAAEIARNSDVGLQFDHTALPLLDGALEYAQQGIAPGGLQSNRRFVERDDGVTYATYVAEPYKLIMHDPQTSGGLLIVIPPDHAERLEAEFAKHGDSLWRIGEVREQHGIFIC